MRRPALLLVAAFALSLGTVVAAACSSNDTEAAPSRPVTPSGGNDGSPNDEGGSADGGEDAACLGEAGCFTCDPVLNVDFLNECTDDLCTPFDNAARLPLYKEGQPLPAIP